MKKKNIFAIAFGALALAMGFSSCKKNKDCAKYSYDGETGCFCVGDEEVETRELFDAYVAYLKAEGYKVDLVKDCD